MKQEPTKVPQCVGMILDGNRRWAKARGIPKLEGHRAGYEKLKETSKSWMQISNEKGRNTRPPQSPYPSHPSPAPSSTQSISIIPCVSCMQYSRSAFLRATLSCFSSLYIAAKNSLAAWPPSLTSSPV
ncbi:MAG: undecaprenyl diphosphate synthase family protein [Candidatus Sungbacteria bacterium]|uniref:Undecaprenyl diphosphate synthase family protein n=1 Tax=Candidatus Sungiibacteriota bacterium TaxID=2750080 RepID=A0A931WPS5_9BACT|nr:undecaprenyl diphosphate synthase family protein [Candidatus Sungbacteria bacterium]